MLEEIGVWAITNTAPSTVIIVDELCNVYDMVRVCDRMSTVETFH